MNDAATPAPSIYVEPSANPGEFFSAFGVNAEVEFRPMFCQQQERGIADEAREGRVVAVRFTGIKVFYDLLDHYTGTVFRDVDSGKVWKQEYPTLLQEVPLGEGAIVAEPA